MKIQFYKLELRDDNPVSDIKNLLRRIYTMKQSEKEKLLFDRTHTLSDFSEEGNIIVVNIAFSRTSGGPGRFVAGEGIEDFEMGEKDGFGEETALAIDCKTGDVAVQYNHFGPRIGAICSYIKLCSNDGENSSFIFNPCMSHDFVSDLESKSKKIDAFSLNVNTDRVLNSESTFNSNTIHDLIKVTKGLNGVSMEITIKAQSKKINSGLDISKVKNILSALIPSSDESSKMQAKIQNIDGVTEILNFLDHISYVKIDNKYLQLSAGKRYTYDSRKTQLIKELSKWKRQ